MSGDKNVKAQQPEASAAKPQESEPVQPTQALPEVAQTEQPAVEPASQTQREQVVEESRQERGEWVDAVSFFHRLGNENAEFEEPAEPTGDPYFRATDLRMLEEREQRATVAPAGHDAGSVCL